MYIPEFTTPDLKFQGGKLDINNVSNVDLYLLAQRIPPVVNSLGDVRRREFLAYLEGVPVVSPLKSLLCQMLKSTQWKTQTSVKIQSVKLIDLIGEEAISWIKIPSKWLAAKDLLEKLRRMFFSEKSSLAQSGIFIAAITSEIGSNDKVFTNTDRLLQAHINLITASTVDHEEHSFLPEIIARYSGEIGRLLAHRQPVRFDDTEKAKKIGMYQDLASNPELEVVIGDEKQHYPSPRIDATSGAIIVPLCPNETKDGGQWVPTEHVKFYEIQEKIVKSVVDDGSRKALGWRDIGYLRQNDTLKPGETRIMEIPIDIWPYDADIEIVCVDKNGNPLPVIHFPATYLDAVRTFADGENRMQVEIKNMWTEPIMFKDIHFRVKLFETNDETREKFKLRRKVQEGEKKWFYPLEHLIYTTVLHGKWESDLSEHTWGLWDLWNLDNLFPHETGLIFSQKEIKGKKIDRCLVVNANEPILPIEWVPLGRELHETDKRTIQSGYLRDFISIAKKACSIGREKRVSLVCRNNISKDDITALIKEHKITDIVSIPWHDGAWKPSHELIEICKKHNIKLTSIEIKSHEVGKEIVHDMVGGKRPE